MYSFLKHRHSLLFFIATLILLPLGWMHVGEANFLQAASPKLTVDFLVTKHEGNPPFTVQFANLSSGDYSSAHWDFGDGQISTAVAPTHTYVITGTYSVTLTVTAHDGEHILTKPNLINVRSFPETHPDGWDLTFGDYGRLNFDICSPNSRVIVQHQADGKILVALDCWPDVEVYELYVLRYLADGAIDLTFGKNGHIQLPDGPLSGFILQADDKFIVLSGLTLYQFDTNGMPDLTFGSNGVAVAFPAVAEGSYWKSAVQADGKIVAVGSVENQRLIARYNPDGTLDTTFNSQGYVLQPVTNDDATDLNASRWTALALQPDGKILVARSANKLIDPLNQTYEITIRLERFIANGDIDPIFGNQGVVELAGYRPQLALQSTGHILVYNDVNNQLLRLSPLGAIDSTFDTGQYSEFEQIYVDSHDRILASGLFHSRFSVVRLLSDGALDTNWGQDGILFLPDETLKLYFILEREGDVLFGMEPLFNSGPVVVRYLDDHSTPPPTTQPLALLYAVLDNNLGESWTRLVNNVEAGARSGLHVRLLIDGPTDNDVYIYDIMQDHNPFCPSPPNPTCNGRYVEGVNFRHVANENSAHPDSLYQFLVDAYADYPTTDGISLALIGHGSGWSANVLPGQPSVWRDQSETIGGMLWDDHPAAGQAESRSLSTRALGQALQWANGQSGKTIDLLYLDGCSMGMAEVAYEVRQSAHFLLASPNVDWASFNYHELLPAVATKSGRALGVDWLQQEADNFRSNPGHPFALSLVDLSKMTDVAQAANHFADALRLILPTQRNLLYDAFTATGHFDSDYNGVLESLDTYADLGDFVTQIGSIAAEGTVVQASQALSDTITLAVIAKDQEGGSPWIFADQEWHWPNYSGLGVYLPLGQDETRRQLFYTDANLGWAAATTWDEFLADFWSVEEVLTAQNSTDLPICHSTSDGCVGLASLLPIQAPELYYMYLPVIAK